MAMDKEAIAFAIAVIAVIAGVFAFFALGLDSKARELSAKTGK
ncbi:MAG: hypothetical protein AAB330_04580 [Bacteroidota bacterium]